MGVMFSQFFPPKPSLTEKNLPNQDGKVFIVTGGYSGVGFELCSILYRAGGKVYLAGRSEEKAKAAITKIKTSERLPEAGSTGEVVFLPLSLDDLASIKPAVEIFAKAESRLDVLFNNAGVSNPPKGSVSAQGHELQVATNCLGPYLFTQLLLPILLDTAKTTNSGQTRVLWTSSITVEASAPKSAMDLSELDQPHSDQQHNYVTSKTGNWFLAHALAKQAGPGGVLSLVLNPGNLKTQLTRHLPWYVPFLVAPLLYEPKMGAYTGLWAGFSGQLKIEDGGKYVLPWGRLHPSPKPEFLAAMKTEEEGGTGIAATFVEHCEKQTAQFR